VKEYLLKQAKEVLYNNFQKKGFTIPSENLYPFQWKWDSGFIAIGYAHFDIEKAKKEIETILSAQWQNGFIPHIVFHNRSDSYFPGPEVHQSKLSKHASKKYASSGITQPPVFGFVLEKLYQICPDKKNILTFIESQINKVYKNHVYFYFNRDIKDEGLVYIYHNWEAGTDNSPLWDDIWETMDPPDYHFKRKDTQHVDPSQRPTKREYDNYIYLIEIAKKYQYDDKKIAANSPFLVQDPLFNSILIRSNQALIELYKIIGGNDKKVTFLEEKQAKSIKSLNTKLFDENLGAYIHYDLRNKRSLALISSSSFTPLFCGAPDVKIAKKLISTFVEKFGGENNYLCASFDPTNIRFNPKKYWRGPVWINLNWILYNGFKKYGYHELAKRIKEDSIELIVKEGFYEYFDPRKGISDLQKIGYGGNNFSWTAALLIDLLNDSY
tara:strand:- start:4740 stop:6056 length:1317 start_codon:yes stop_codon:yes gene_type:complete